MALSSAADGAIAASAAHRPPQKQAENVFEWLARKSAEERTPERILNAIRTAAGVVPLSGRAPLASGSTALLAAPAATDDVFFDVLLTCVELPASVGRTEQRTALKTYLQDRADLGFQAPSSSEDSASWWRVLTRARAAYFSARRAFFLVRIELLRVAAFQSTSSRGLQPPHPHAAVVQDVVRQLVKDGLVDALLEELGGRERLTVPAFYAHLRADLPREEAERHLRAAQHAWEQQLLDEEELLRELLVLALHFTNERVPLSRATDVIEQLLRWPAVVVPELFSHHSLAIPLFQRKLQRVAAIGSTVTLKLVHRACQQSLDNEWATISSWTQKFIVPEAWHVEVDDHHVELCDELTESGVVIVAWAALLATLYRRTLDGQSNVDQPQLERDLQTVLKASEQARGFQQVRDVLRCLVFDNASPSQFSFVKSTQGTNGATSWDLPPTTTNSLADGAKKSYFDVDGDHARVAVFQLVGASFVDDALAVLGYVDHVEEEAQLNAMVKLVRPVLANSSVADAVLQGRPIVPGSSEFGSALSTLFHESRASWPQNLLAGLRVLTALCAAAKSPSPPSTHARALAVQLTLNELTKKRKTASLNTANPWRALPPNEYLEFIPEQEAVVCRRTFTYTDNDRLLVTDGTRGVIDHDEQGHELVQWQLKAEYHNAWETLLTTLEALVDQIQNQPLIAIDSAELETFTAFLELVVQASNGADAAVVLTQVMQQWAHARLKQWWREMGLPSGASVSEDDGGIPALLFRNKVSLMVLQSASREDLVAWGVHDRFMREQILARIAFPEGSSSVAAHQQRRAASAHELERDGLTHLLRMLLGFLDGFVNEHAIITDQDESLDWTPKQLHFISAVLAVLAKLTSSLGMCIDVLIHELGGGTEECVQLILTSTRKLFEYHESTAGLYTGLFASLTLLMNVSRWCLAHEAVDVSSGVLSRLLSRSEEIVFRAAERHWLVATVEFLLEIVSTHETWWFVAIRDKWTLLDRCFRLFTTLLSATFQNPAHSSLLEFQETLRQSIVLDKPLLMKVLRSAARLVVKEDATTDGEQLNAFGFSTSGATSESCMYPLSFEREVTNGTSGLLAREALVASSLGLLDLVMHQCGESANLASVFALPIDDDGIHERTALNLVTLCGGYLAYPLTKNTEIVLTSLKMLRRAVKVTATSSGSTDPSDVDHRSLVTLFRDTKDLEYIRDTLLGLVRSPSATAMALRKQLLELLTTCLDNQPGFFAVLVLDGDADQNDATMDKTKRLVGMVERFLESSDKLIEGNAVVLCSILRFLRHIWVGGVKERRKLHQQIAAALRKSARFWKNLTQVLCVRLPLSMDLDEDDWAMSMDPDDSNFADRKSAGRSGVFASLARGMILEIIACEWHYVCKNMSDHPLLAVLDSFREEGLYAHWLRTFTRLDYNAARFAEIAESVKGYVVPFPHAMVVNNATAGDQGETVLSYHEEMLSGLITLKWQLGPVFQRRDGELVETWKRAQWSSLVSSHAAAQIYALSRWKVFMELYSLQPTPTADDNNDATGDSAADVSTAVTTNERRKRKESMIASPPRAARANAPVSPLHKAAASSYFSGDRTSYGMVQVLSETVLAQLQRHERDQESGAPSFDVFSLSHLKHLVDLLVSMLHHQIRVIVRKTRDPKMSATRARDSSSGRNLRLTVGRSIELLALVERAARQVLESNTKTARAAALTIVVSDTSSSAKPAELWERLAGGSYGQELDTLTLGLRSSLLAAALLLTRHITAQYATHDGVLDHELVQRAVVIQVKLTQHAIESIKLCDRAGRSSQADLVVGRLFQVSWSLLHALLDDFTALTIAHEKQKFKLDAIIVLGPLVALLQHETNGLRALFEIVATRFHAAESSSATSRAQQLQACAVLRGINAVVWNPKNAELCRHVMFGEDPINGFSVLRYFAKKLVPALQECIEKEKQSGAVSRGYCREGVGELERSSAHLAWCSVLMIAGGLVRQFQPPSTDKSVWEFVSSSESLLATALSPTPRLNRAVVEEQACAVTFLNALSASAARRKQWREMLPRNHVVLMEQSRLALRRACVLLGNSSYTAARQREQQHQAQLQKKPRRLSVTAWPLSSSPRAIAAASNASLTFAHQTLLHEQLEATASHERRHPLAFYSEMESKLIHVVEQGTHLLLKWTAGVTSRAATVSVHGSRLIDDEQLIPLLALVVPSESLTLSCEPSVGHLCIAMEFCVEQLKKLTENEKEVDKTAAAVEVAVNAIQTSALLFLKTYLLHVDQQPESLEDQQKDFAGFFEQLVDEMTESTQVKSKVDVAFLQQILQIVRLKTN